MRLIRVWLYSGVHGITSSLLAYSSWFVAVSEMMLPDLLIACLVICPLFNWVSLSCWPCIRWATCIRSVANTAASRHVLPQRRRLWWRCTIRNVSSISVKWMIGNTVATCKIDDLTSSSVRVLVHVGTRSFSSWLSSAGIEVFVRSFCSRFRLHFPPLSRRCMSENRVQIWMIQNLFLDILCNSLICPSQ